MACLEQRVLGPAPRSEAGAVLGKLRLEDRFQNMPGAQLFVQPLKLFSARRPKCATVCSSAPALPPFYQTLCKALERLAGA